MKFQVSECPLCGNTLKMKMAYGVTTYYCAKESKPHYEVEADSKETIQHAYVFPYAVDTYVNSTKSRVYRWRDSRWKFVKEVPRVVLTRQSELLSFLKHIVPLPGTPFPNEYNKIF